MSKSTVSNEEFSKAEKVLMTKISIIQLIKNSWILSTDKKRIYDRLLPLMVVLIFVNLIQFFFVMLIETGVMGNMLTSFGFSAVPIANVLSVLFFVMILSCFFIISTGVFYSFDAIEKKPSFAGTLEVGFSLLFSFLFVFLLNVLLVSFGLLFLIVPGIYFAIRYSMSLPAVILEKKKGIAALSMSKELTMGYFWTVFFGYLVLFFLFFVFYCVFFAIIRVNMGSINLIVNIVVIPFSIVFLLAYQFNLYKHLVNVKVIELERIPKPDKRQNSQNLEK